MFTGAEQNNRQCQAAGATGVWRVKERPLQQLTILVTGDGKWVLPDSEEFRAALGDPNPDYDAVGFAVRNLGFVKFQVLDRLVTEIELLHPRNVERAGSLLALERLLGEVGTNLFRIRYLEDEWRSEISSLAEHTVARLRELCAPVFEPPSAEKFSADIKNYDQLGRDGAVSLRLFAQKWRTAFGNFDSDVISFAVDHRILPRMMITQIAQPNSDPVFQLYRRRSRGARRTLSVRGPRPPHAEHAGQGLRRRWIAEFYKAVAASAPAALRHRPAPTSRISAGASQVIRYERLLLPWKTSSGGVLVSLVSNRIADNSGTEAGTLTGPPLARKLAKSS